MPESRMLLVRFPWAVADAVDGLVASAAPAQRPPLYRSLAGSEGYAWLLKVMGVDATAMRDCTPGITLAPWLAVRATPWSDRVRPQFTNTKRGMFRRE